jgi:hypothetical protein
VEYFYSGGGNNRPDFTYRFLVSKITEEMYDWCDNYPLTGPFERWHIINNYYESRPLRIDRGDSPETPLIQFESRKAAYMFRIAFSEYIIENKTYGFAKEWLEKGFG